MAAGLRTIKIKIDGSVDGLRRAAKAAEKAVDGMNKGIASKVKNLAGKLPDILSGVVDAIPPMGKPIAIAVGAGFAVALAPILAAGITSALLLAVGGGALALGIKAAIDNPKVAAAFDGLKKKGSKLFEDFGKPFEQPLIRAAKTFSKVLDDLRPAVERIGKMIAPVIDKLAPALGEFFKNVMPGIESAVKASLPLFNTLAEKLPKIGTAIGTFFGLISQNGDDANEFFGDLLDAIIYVIIGLGKAISVLTGWYKALKEMLEKAKEAFKTFKEYTIGQLERVRAGAERALGWIPGIGGKLRGASGEFDSFQGNANRALKKIKDRNVKVTVTSNIGSIAAQYANAIGSIIKQGGQVSGARASGGAVIAGRSYLVGENRAEIFTPATNGRISSSAGSGEQTLNLFLDLSEGVSEAFEIKIDRNNRATVSRLRATGRRV